MSSTDECLKVLIDSFKLIPVCHVNNTSRRVVGQLDGGLPEQEVLQEFLLRRGSRGHCSRPVQRIPHPGGRGERPGTGAPRRRARVEADLPALLVDASGVEWLARVVVAGDHGRGGPDGGHVGSGRWVWRRGGQLDGCFRPGVAFMPGQLVVGGDDCVSRVWLAVVNWHVGAVRLHVVLAFLALDERRQLHGFGASQGTNKKIINKY